MTLALTSITPDSGTKLGGQTATITGSGILANATVKFDGVSATITSQSATELVVTTPAHAAGAVDVVVRQGVPNPNDTWADLTTGARFVGVSISQDGQYVLAAGNNGNPGANPLIKVSSDYGATWTTFTYGTGYVPSCTAMSDDGQYMYCVSAIPADAPQRCLFYSIDYGASWNSRTLSLPGSSYPYFVACSADGRVVLVTGWIGVSGSSSYSWSVDYGATFSSSALDLHEHASAAVSATGQYVYISTGIAAGNPITLSRNSCASWLTYTFQNEKCHAIACDSTGAIVIAATATKCYKSLDYAATWVEMGATPATLTLLVGSDDLSVLVGSTTPSSTGLGVLYVSTDYGATWTQKRASDSYRQVALDAAGTRIVVALSAAANKVIINDQSPTPETATLTYTYTLASVTLPLNGLWQQQFQQVPLFQNHRWSQQQFQQVPLFQNHRWSQFTPAVAGKCYDTLPFTRSVPTAQHA